jgi:hypothetical protein
VTLEIKSTSATIVDDRIQIVIGIFNHTNRTHYAYNNVRSFNWDPALHTLKLYLTDVAYSESMQNHPHLKLPNIRTLAANEQTDIKVSLPVEFSRMGKDSLKIEQVSMRSVQHVEVQLAFADTPFYHKVGKETLGRQLLQWVGNSQLKQTIKVARSKAEK